MDQSRLDTIRWNGIDGVAMYTIVDGNIVHKREAGGPLRGTPTVKPGSTGRVLKFN